MRRWLRAVTVGLLAGALDGTGVFHAEPAEAVNAWPRRAVTLAATPDGEGLWIGYANGEVQTVGNARSVGDARTLQLNQPIVGISPTPTGNGTGCSPLTAGCSPTGTPGSTGPPGRCG